MIYVYTMLLHRFALVNTAAAKYIQSGSRSLKRLAHTAQCYHFSDLIFRDTVLASFSSEAAQFDATESVKHQPLYLPIFTEEHLRSSWVTD